MVARRRVLLTAVVGVVLAALVATAVAATYGVWYAVADVAAGSTVIALGVIASRLHPGRGTGTLLVAAGGAWFLADLMLFSGPVGMVGGVLTFLHRAVIAHAVLAVPSGRLMTARARMAIGAVYVASVIPALWTNPFSASGAAVLLAIASIVAAVRAPRRERRARTLGAWGGSVFAAAIALSAVVRATQPTPSTTTLSLALYAGAFVAAATLVFAATLVREGVAADAVIEAADAPGRTLQDALAWAIGDRALRLGRPDSVGRFVDPDGRDVGKPGPGREIRKVHDGGREVARIDVASGALDGTDLPGSLDVSVRLDARNAALRADVQARAESVAASRRRLLSAADDEERRLEQRLSRATGPHLERISAALEDAAATASPADRLLVDDVKRSLRSLEDLVAQLSAGIYPRSLASEGLVAVLARATSHFPVATSLVADVGELPEDVSLAAYYVVQEGLANAAKHARATQIDVRLDADQELVIVVKDNGVGGADTRSALGGLGDRLAALGGSIAITSLGGQGTTLRAVVPLAGEAM